MSRILLDTNAALDLVFPREPERKEAMLAIVTSLRENRDKLLLPSLSLKDVSYLIECSKPAKSRWPQREEREHMAAEARSFLLDHCSVVAIDDLVCRRAHRNQMEPNYDDALIAECAVTSGADAIISSDRLAFNAAAIPKFTPQEFAKHLMLRNG